MAQKTPIHPAEAASKQAHISVERYFEISLLLMLGISFPHAGRYWQAGFGVGGRGFKLPAYQALGLWARSQLFVSPRTVHALGCLLHFLLLALIS